MPTTYVDKTIDFKYSNVSPEYKDVDVDLVLADDENIGAYNIPVVYKTASLSDAVNNIVTEYFATTSGYLSTAIRDLNIDFRASDVSSSVYDSLVNYFATPSGYVVDWFTDSDVSFYISSSGLGTQNTSIDFIVGELYNFYRDVYTEYWTTVSSFEDLDYIINYTKPIKNSFGRDISTLFSISSTASGSQNKIVDITFTGYVWNDIAFDLFSSLLNTRYIDFETTTISGGVKGYYSDIFSTASGTRVISNDVFCCLVDYAYVDYETTVISGGLGWIKQDVYSTISDMQQVGFDIELFSLKISNFSLAEGEYTSALGTICVDITDDWYSVVTSGTYFEFDGTQVSGTFSSITDGYRMCYDPVDDFSSLMGSTTVIVHAENDNGDVLEKDYYLTYGYKVEFSNWDRKLIDFGFENKIVVRMRAENLMSCPKESVDAYWFETKSLYHKDLSCSIRGSYIEDLTASIFPQSTAYFYGKTYRLVVNASDFAANKMQEFVLEYTIEDKPG